MEDMKDKYKESQQHTASLANKMDKELKNQKSNMV